MSRHTLQVSKNTSAILIIYLKRSKSFPEEIFLMAMSGYMWSYFTFNFVHVYEVLRIMFVQENTTDVLINVSKEGDKNMCAFCRCSMCSLCVQIISEHIIYHHIKFYFNIIHQNKQINET